MDSTRIVRLLPATHFLEQIVLFSVFAPYGPWARGGAMAVGYVVEELAPDPEPTPEGQVWNMVYDPDAPDGTVAPVSRQEIWQRLEHFLEEVVPVAEEARVRLASHPDDPPLPELRGAARLVYEPELYQKLLDIVPSHYNALEFCVGTLSEMSQGQMDVYEATDVL